jgi:hypothetical protein
MNTANFRTCAGAGQAIGNHLKASGQGKLGPVSNCSEGKRPHRRKLHVHGVASIINGGCSHDRDLIR